MALIIGDNFSYQGAKPLDDRLVTQTLATLLSISPYTIFDGIQVYVQSEQKFYVYDSHNDVDTVLDKWRELSIDASADVLPILHYGDVFAKGVNTDETILFVDVSGASDISEIQENQLINDVAGILARVISIDEGDAKIQVRILTKDTIIKQDVVKYDDELEAEIDKVQTVDFNKIDPTGGIADFSTNNLIYGTNGVLAKVVAKDEANNELTVVPVSLSIAIQEHEVYLTTGVIPTEINKQSWIPVADLVPAKLVKDIEKTQLVYDSKGTVAKIVDIHEGDAMDPVDKVEVTTISTSTDASVNIYKYSGSSLSKIPYTNSAINYLDLNTTKLLNDLKVNELIYDDDGTVAVIINIDIPNAQLLTRTLTTAGMPYAPVLKELQIKEQGINYQVGDIVESSTTGVFGEVTDVGTNGEIYAVKMATATVEVASGYGAQLDYDTVIYGAFGKQWSPLHYTSSQVAQIVQESFTYNNGFEYDIISAGTGYQIGDIVDCAGNMVEVTRVNAGQVEAVKFSRETAMSSLGTGLTINVNASNDVYIIPDDIWHNSRRNSFDLTNDDGASVEFNRLDGITMKCAAGSDSIYKFEFDSINGVIYQEKTEVAGSSSGIGRFVPYKNYKVDDVIIEDNLVYMCNTDHTAKGTFGEDVVDWTLMTKLHSSGMRYVQFSFPKQTKPVVTWNTVENLTYISGDQSMMSSSELIAPISGLYYINAFPFSSSPSGDKKHTIIRVRRVKDDSVIANSQSCGQWLVQDNCVGMMHLDANEKIRVQVYYDAMPTVGGYTSEFGLISADQTDNLAAEAELDLVLPTNADTAYIETYKNSTDQSVINANGDIILPEDGSYIFDIDAITTSGITKADRFSYIMNESNRVVSTNSLLSTSKVLTPGLTKVVTGTKGQKFQLYLSSSVANIESDVTKEGNPKIRIFKVKATNVSLSSKDLYADYLEDHKSEANVLSYEDWVAKKFNEGNLTVTVPLTTGQNISDTASVLTFAVSDATGETDMIKDNNKIIAPVSGLYSININELVVNNTFEWARQILSKNSVNTGWEGSIDFSSGENINVCPGLTKQVWLNKGDYISVKAAANTNMVVRATTASPEANRIIVTLLHTGAPDANINYPNTWPENQEVNLGNGVYGYRATGTITAPANTKTNTTIIDKDVTNYKILSQGGEFNIGIELNSSYPIGASLDNSSSTDVGKVIRFSSFVIDRGQGTGKSNRIYLATWTSNARTNAPYDAWITYIKGGNN